MLFSAPAKLNLSFEITGKREDGYHDIRSEIQTIFLHDYLWIEKSQEYQYTGALVCPIEELLVTKAVLALEEHIGNKLPVWVNLEKVIPIAAGMGGGSSDAAATLLGINQVYEVGLPEEELMAVAGKVGADVPFFIKGGKCMVEGYGEKMTELPPDDERVYYIVFRPHKRLSTKAAYQEYDLTGESFSDMARRKCPQLGEVFKRFPDAIVSGKGPTAFIKRAQREDPILSELLIEMLPHWGGDIFITVPDPSSSPSGAGFGTFRKDSKVAVRLTGLTP